MKQLLDIIAMVSFTFWMVNQHFSLPWFFPVWMFPAIMLISLFVIGVRYDKEGSFNRELSIVLYMAFVIVLVSILERSPSVIINNPLIWVLLLISAFHLYPKWKIERQQ